MRINGNAIRPGNVIEHKGGLWRAVKIAHTQPGKGGAYLQVELRNLRDGSKLNERFRASENVERVRLDQKEHQFLFGDGDSFTFMDSESYEQIELNADLLGDQAAYLQDGMTVSIESYEGSILGISLPEHVSLEVGETEPVVKGQTAAASYKPAVLSNGVRTSVPPFVGIGDVVVVSTDDGGYVKRADS
ncbi:MAG: elongation factor P [Alphaproteobacteria bacterium]|jgi:elongation factor P|nr:elongation factor P [Alphaproteobacteria bacterium]MDP6815685.1 elongation factor P [Alphaproteobacteria bacterium]